MLPAKFRVRYIWSGAYLSRAV